MLIARVITIIKPGSTMPCCSYLPNPMAALPSGSATLLTLSPLS